MKVILPVVLVFIAGFHVSGNDGYKRNPMIDIINYSFSVSLSDTSDIIYGNSSITIGFKGPVSSFDLDLMSPGLDGKGMVIDSAWFSTGNISWSRNGGKVTFTPGTPLNHGQTAVLTISYHGIPSGGLVISNNKYGDRTFFSDNWPNRASSYLPCIDHPYDKATVDFYITAPSHYDIVANGYLVEESHLTGDRKLTHWKEGVPLATKVMAFGAAEFDFRLAGEPDNIPVWSYVFRENRNEGFYDYAVAVRPLAFYVSLIGPYSYEKLANVQSKTIFGGLENAGCVFYAQNSVTGKGNAEGLLAHEIAHQWFGNSVTENDWDHIWLSEGFATYLTSVYMEKTYGMERFQSEMKADREQVISFFMKYPRPVIDTTVTNLMRLLNANSYQKGAWVLHMLNNELGDDLFWKGMRLFYERFRNGNALTGDFRKVMEEVSGRDLSGFFEQWLYIAGQPDLKITTERPRNGSQVIIIEQKQEHLFTFPLELLVKCLEGDQNEKINVSGRETRVTIKTRKINEVIPDPNVNLLFRVVP
ncbi:MAG: M1 family metallopeptidase [Bacteroidales bacterium]